MSITTLPFMLFIFGGAVIYYIVPKKVQWMWLLVLSLGFYLSGDKAGVEYILLTAATIWLGALGINRFRENVGRQKLVFWLVLGINLGILIVFKSLIFAAAKGFTAKFASGRLSAVIMPLGLSFYTFQALAYLIDVYWGKLEPEKNPARLLLYLSFFPQVVQGPIARYQDLGAQLKFCHSFDIDDLEAGILRILWGFFKKAVIADRLLGAVAYVFDETASRSAGMILLGALLYAVQSYGDFSGGIDIVTGAAKIYGIELAPNFERPYFSRSLGEFWRRWHISLGAWMREYVFYPFSVASGTRKLTKWAKNRFGKQTGKVLPVVLGNILVFFLVGAWHGFFMQFIVWGLYNGVILAFSAAMEPVYKKWKTGLKIKDGSRAFAAFQVIRTFIIVVMGGLFDRAACIAHSGELWARLFTGPFIEEKSLGTAFKATMDAFGFAKIDLLIIVAAIFILFACELYEEISGQKLAKKLFDMPLVLRWALLILFIYFIIIGHVDLGPVAEFMYAEF